jgi:hypothetical protein
MNRLFARQPAFIALLIYLFFTPLSFLIQSLTQSKIILLPLSGILVYFICSSFINKDFSLLSGRSIFEKSITSIFLASLVLGFSVILVFHNEYSLAARNAIVYVLPTFLFFSLSKYADQDRIIKASFKVIVAVALIVSLIQIYSYSAPPPTYLEQKLYDYVRLEYGVSVGEFLGSYRRQGPTDHIHVTSLFLALGSIFSFFAYLTKKNFWKGAIFYLILLGLWATGVRLSIISVYVSFAATVFFLKRYKVFPQLVVASLLCLAYLGITALNFDHYKKIYIYPIIYLEFAPETTLTSSVVKPAFSQLLLAFSVGSTSEILFGHGFSSPQATRLGLNNDDIFFIQILTNFGILGLLAFYGMFGYFIWRLLRHPQILKEKKESLAILFVLFIMLITTAHSGIIFRRLVFPFFILFFAFARYLSGPPKETMPLPR